MDNLIFSDWLQLITTVSVVLVVFVNFMTIKDRNQGQASDQAEMRSDVKHIREKVDRLDDLPERMMAVEGSVSSAHKRIDRIEDKVS